MTYSGKIQEKVEIIKNHTLHFWTKIPKNGYCTLVVYKIKKHQKFNIHKCAAQKNFFMQFSFLKQSSVLRKFLGIFLNPEIFRIFWDFGQKSAGAKGDVSKIYRFMHPLHPC